MRIVRKIQEQWRDVVGFEGYYQISDTGRVRAYPKSNYKRFRILAPFVNNMGYEVATFCVDGEKSKHMVHRLVLTAFRRAPRENEVTLHGPGGTRDNRLQNVRWGTQSQNLLERETGIGETHGNAKLTENDVIAMHAALAAGASPREVAEQYGVTVENVYLIRSGKAWRHTYAAFHKQT